jgi:hypothetical protein
MQQATNEKPFRCDCVKLKRAIQRKIYEATKYMTPEERRERTQRASNEFWADIERRRAEMAAENQT